MRYDARDIGMENRKIYSLYESIRTTIDATMFFLFCLLRLIDRILVR